MYTRVPIKCELVLALVDMGSIRRTMSEILRKVNEEPLTRCHWLGYANRIPSFKAPNII